MNLNKLAVEAKVKECSLKRLLQKTLKYRILYANKLKPISHENDHLGELQTLTWQAVRTYDIERGARFTTYLLSIFNKYVSREYEKAFKERRKKESVLQNSRRIGNRYVNSGAMPFVVYVHDFVDYVEKFVCGAEKIVWDRAIKLHRTTFSLVREGVIAQRKAYRARSNIMLLAKAYLCEDALVLGIVSYSVYIRGLAEDLVNEDGLGTLQKGAKVE